MHGVRVESSAAQALRQLIRDHHRTVTPASATDSDSEIRLALALVLRQEVIEQIAEATQSLFHLGLGFQVLDNAPVAASQRAQSVDKKGIRQMANVKHEFHVPRRAELVPKAEHLNTQRRRFAARAETLEQNFSERMDRMVRSIDDFVGQRARTLHGGAFGSDGVEQALAAIGGMRPPRFAESAHENLVGRFKEYH